VIPNQAINKLNKSLCTLGHDRAVYCKHQIPIIQSKSFALSFKRDLFEKGTLSKENPFRRSFRKYKDGVW
jgi:hypothetical protein